MREAGFDEALHPRAPDGEFVAQMWHGTSKAGGRALRGGSPWRAGAGGQVFVTSHKPEAGDYAGRDWDDNVTGDVLPVTVHLKKPLVLGEGDSLGDVYRALGIERPDASTRSFAEQAAALKKAGYDGVIQHVRGSASDGSPPHVVGRIVDTSVIRFGHDLREAVSVGRFEAGLHPRSRDGKFSQKWGGSRAKALEKRVARAVAKRSHAEAQRQAVPVARERFHAAFEDAMKGNEFTAFVSHHSLAEMTEKGMTPVTQNGGKTGVLVFDHGDGDVEGTALYNSSSVKGAGRAMLRQVVASNGVNYVECFGDVLSGIYRSLGFVDNEVMPFSDEYAPDGWDYARHGRPDYHVMRLPGNPNYAVAKP